MENNMAGQAFTSNPYVVQIDKFASSMQRLSSTFLRLEGRRDTFTEEEIDKIYGIVTEKVCFACGNYEKCMEEGTVYTYQLLYEILSVIEEYGIELNVEMKRKLKKRCVWAPRFLRETLEAFQNAKQELAWNNRIAQNREGCAIQLDTFAHVIQHAARELESSIFVDEFLEKKIKNQFRKIGLRLLGTVFFLTGEGRYEIHVTVRAGKNQCVTTKEMAKVLSSCVGRNMILEQDERPVIRDEYCTITCMEGARFYTLQGVAKIGKGCEKISGDSFLMMELPGGKEGVVLSDGMGAGERASKESAMVVEMLEELLASGFPTKTAIQMMNTALVMGREELYFSTIDISLFDLYKGTCEFIKAGASTTYIKGGDKIEKIHSSSLPIGVLQQLEVQGVHRRLEEGDFVIMVTDGVLDAMPPGEQDEVMEEILLGADINNPKELAHYILAQVLAMEGMIPLDDMTVLVIGLWSLEK